MLALFLQALTGTSARIDAAREARILDPYERVSADGRSLFHVDPSELEGRGPSTVYLLRDGQLAWVEDLPFTLRDAVLARDGAVLGCALDEQLWFRGAMQSAFRELPPPYEAIPRTMVVGLLDLDWEDAALVRVRDAITDATGRSRAERWWRFDFARGAWGSTVVPEGAIGPGFALLLVDSRMRVLLASESGPEHTVWSRVLDSQGCTQGLRPLGGIGFDPVELAYDDAPACGNAWFAEKKRLQQLERERASGLDLRPRLRVLRTSAPEVSCAWPHVTLDSLGTRSDATLEAELPVAPPAAAQRRIDGSWINVIVASARLPDGGYALVDLPKLGRGERSARLLLTDAAGTVVDQHLLPFAEVSAVTSRGDWIAVVPRGRATVALLERRTRQRFEVLTRTCGRDALAALSADATELAVLDEEQHRLERFRLQPR